LIHLRYFAPEIAALISAVREIFSLLKYKALYAENFYGLERVSSRSMSTILLELLLWVLLPYLSRKLEQLYASLKDQQADRLGTLAKVFLAVFPVVFCIVKVVSVVFKFLYLLVPNSKYYNIQYWASKTELEHLRETETQSPYPIMVFLKSPGLFLLLAAHKLVAQLFSMVRKPKSKA
jgi:ABC-type Fe3+ transport system permease subunit